MNVIVDDFRIKTFGMTLHLNHQIWTLQTLGSCRPVLNIRRGS